MSTPNLHTVWPLPGGIHPPECKAATRDEPIRRLPLPKRLYVAMEQHAGRPAQPCVAVGEALRKGQLIGRDPDGHGAAVHAPSSGRVAAVQDYPLCHPSGLYGPHVVIDTDGEDRWLEHAGLPDWQNASKDAIIARVREAGIVGLGGAGFPTAHKLATHNPLHTLILNGAECEPYITCDDRLMRERAAEVVAGGRILLDALGVPRCLIGVEDNKPEAIEALWQAVRAAGDERLHVVAVPTRYPSGGQKQLIYLLSGEEVPSGARSSSIGYLMHNVMTAAAVYRAVALGEPLISRIVTVAGGQVGQPGNYEVLLGMPVAELLEQAGCERHGRLILGGPMMGFALTEARIAVSKTANCVIAPSDAELPLPGPAKPCIRCGLCVDACPAGLLPQQLYWFARAEEHDKAVKHHLFDCIECGACAYVCPSELPLVSYYRASKGAVRAEREAKKKAEAARVRHEARAARLERDRAEKAEKLKRATEARRAELAADPDKQAALAAALARVQASEAAAAPAPEPVPTEAQAAADPAAARKAEIAAAIARAKARKSGPGPNDKDKPTP